MSAEAPCTSHQESASEKQEWVGQKWEYLVAQFKVDNKTIVVEERTSATASNPLTLLKRSDKDSLIEEYNTAIKELGAKKKGNTPKDGLDLLGRNGWELVVGVSFNTWNHYLIFKRPIV